MKPGVPVRRTRRDGDSMFITLNVLSLMFLQEIGFDIVSIWGQTSYLAMGVVILLLLLPVFFVGLIISRIVQRKRKGGN